MAALLRPEDMPEEVRSYWRAALDSSETALHCLQVAQSKFPDRDCGRDMTSAAYWYAYEVQGV